MKGLKTFGLLCLYGALLFTIYYLHVLYFPVEVVFYSAVLDAILATLVLAAIFFWAKFIRFLTRFEKVLVCFLSLALGYAFAITVPTIIDRSLSFYILEKLQQRGGSIPYDQFDHVLRDEYMKEHRLVDIRLTEQMASGTVTLDHGIVRLTPRGVWFASMSRFYRLNLLPKHRLLMGVYTDVLTDPFRKGDSSAP